MPSEMMLPARPKKLVLLHGHSIPVRPTLLSDFSRRMRPPNIIFGSANVGFSYTTLEQTKALLSCLEKLGIKRIDTARRYPPAYPGRSEEYLGWSRAPDQFAIDTKTLIEPKEGLAGCLSRENILASVEQSFNALGVNHVNVLHCHAADPVTPIEESAAAFDELYRRGVFKELGFSNFATKQIEDWVAVSEARGWVKPTVYQGQYNALCRNAENGFLSMLRKHKLDFNAFSPLAGGFLTGLPSQGITTGSRFESGFKYPQHQAWYQKPTMNEAVKALHEFVRPKGLSVAEVSLRWLAHHSQLGEEDGIIIGGSKAQHIEEGVRTIEKGPLDEDVVEAVARMWMHVKADAP